MNFFSHALMAAEKQPSPRFVLGSMLPDLASMMRVRVPLVSDPALGEGVVFHHATDHAFHESSSFRRLNRAALADLTRLGVRRGTARAVAHVGIEYFVDGELAGLLERAIPSYREALAEGRTLEDGIEWPATDQRLGFAGLCVRLERIGVDALAGGSKTVVARLDRALANRPRLAIGEADLPRVQRWAQGQSGLVASEMPALLDELRQTLGLAARHG